MYIEKRWIVPAGLSLLLLSALFAWVLLMLGSRFPQAAGNLRPSQIANVEAPPQAAKPITQAAPVSDPAPSVVPAPADVMASTQPAQVASASSTPVVNDASPSPVAKGRTVGAAPTPADSQSNTRGFGDIGLQLQDTYINGPVTIAHISSQGNNDSTNLVMGDNDKISSNQEHLQSNRTDSTPPPTAAAPAQVSTQSAPRHLRK